LRAIVLFVKGPQGPRIQKKESTIRANIKSTMKRPATAILALLLISVGTPAALFARTESGNSTPAEPRAPLHPTRVDMTPMTVERIRSLIPGLTQSEAEQLMQKGVVTSDYSKSIQARIAPPFAGKQEMIKELGKTDATVGIELLFQAPIPVKFRERDDFWLEIYNIMRSISTLKGIKYYSADRDEMRTFYYDAYVVPSPEKKNVRLPDPLVGSIPASSHIYTYHKDSSFGDYVMSINYTAGPDPQHPKYARMAMSNATTMHYSIIPIEQPYKLQIDLVVVPVGDTMLFYGNFVANAYTIFGLRDSIDVSFTNRVKALYNWFMAEVTLHS
jgi:hypothetical protein